MNHKQIRWRHTGNAFLGLQHRHFWQSGTFTFCWKWRWGQISIKLALSSSAANSNSQTFFTWNTQGVFNYVSFIWESSKNVTQNEYYFNVLPTHKLKTIFHRRNTNYSTTMVLQWKIMQHNSGGTVQYW